MSMPGTLIGAAGHDDAAVIAQLAKVLGSTHFRNSKRSQALLRFVVEAALTGDQNSLKERCVGIGVFGRDTAYDTAQDPVVRNAAIEVRKRLAQYYMEREHASELRIELPLGSYSPAFSTPHPTVEAPLVEPPKPAVVGRGHLVKWTLAVGCLLLAATATFFWAGRRTPASELEAFWEPIFRDRNPIQICIGQPSRLYRFTGPRTEQLNHTLASRAPAETDTAGLSIAGRELLWVAPEYLFLRDALSAFNVARWIQSKGRAFQLMSVSQTNYSRLRHAPLIAIGAFNNPWSLRVTSELRFLFDHRTEGGITYNYIHDRRNPNAVSWSVAQPADGAFSEDYAIVTRVFDPDTEKTVISAAGIETFGTLAASEFVTEPQYLGVALRAAPSDWRRRKVQFVLATSIIDGTPGPPRVLAAHFW